MKNTKSYVVLVLIAFLTFSCSKDDGETIETIQEIQFKETAITDHIINLGFSKKGIRDMGDYYTVIESEVTFAKKDYEYLLSLPKVKKDEIPKLSNKASCDYPVYRYFNSGARDHFYTTNWTELGYGAHGYVYEKVEFYASPFGFSDTSLALHRYFNPQRGDHFYTTNFSALGNGGFGYIYEGIQCYLAKTGNPSIPACSSGLPIYSYFNLGVVDHMLTLGDQELGDGKYGYAKEGVVGYE